MWFHFRGRLVRRKAGEWSSVLGGSRRHQWKSGDSSWRFRRAKAEGDGSGRCHKGWRRPCVAWIGECGGGGGGSTVGRALLAGNGLGGRGIGALPFFRRRRREGVSWDWHSRRKLKLGQLSRGRHGLGTSLGHGDGVASRGACRGRAAPGELVWGESRGGQCGLGLGLGTCPPRWPAPAYGVAGGRGAGRRRWKMLAGAIS